MKSYINRASCALLAAASLAAPAVASGKALVQKERNGTVHAAMAAPAAGGVGWQKIYNFAVPQGKNIIFSYKCPDSAKTPVSNSFSANTAAKVGLQLVSSFRPLNSPQEWDWAISWPSGAPANSHIYFNVYCVQ
jgi:hypothetical protein